MMIKIELIKYKPVGHYILTTDLKPKFFSGIVKMQTIFTLQNYWVMKVVENNAIIYYGVNCISESGQN